MEKYNSGFERLVKIDLNSMQPTYFSQKLTNYDTNEVFEFDTNMKMTYIERLLKKYSKYFQKLFKGTWSMFADIIYKNKGESNELG